MPHIRENAYFCPLKLIRGLPMPLGLQERYVNFYTDFAFKKLFGTEANKELLRSFLNSLLNGEENITKLTYLNTEQLGTQEIDRKAVFDVYCENENSNSSRTEAYSTPLFPSGSKPNAGTGTIS